MSGGRGPAKAVVTDVAVALGTYLLVGAACAVAWWLLTDLPEFTKARGGGGSMGELQLAERFNADGWFAVLGAVAGFLTGAGLSWWRSRDPLLTTLLVGVGSAMASWTTATLGGLLGPVDPDVALATAAPGQTVPTELMVTASAAYLVWPIAALLGTLMVLWSPTDHDAQAPNRSQSEPAGTAEDAGHAQSGNEDPATSHAQG